MTATEQPQCPKCGMGMILKSVTKKNRRLEFYVYCPICGYKKKTK